MNICRIYQQCFLAVVSMPICGKLFVLFRYDEIVDWLQFMFLVYSYPRWMCFTYQDLLLLLLQYLWPLTLGLCFFMFQVSQLMDRFEQSFENLDVQSQVMEGTMSNSSTLTTPQAQVDSLMQEVADEAGYVTLIQYLKCAWFLLSMCWRLCLDE